jgi:hypothetical protein
MRLDQYPVNSCLSFSGLPILNSGLFAILSTNDSIRFTINLSIDTGLIFQDKFFNLGEPFFGVGFFGKNAK